MVCFPTRGNEMTIPIEVSLSAARFDGEGFEVFKEIIK
jgi:hypothetical protein